MAFATVLAVSVVPAHAEPDETDDTAVETVREPPASSDSTGAQQSTAEADDTRPSDAAADDPGEKSKSDEKAVAEKSAPEVERPEKLIVASWGGAYGESQRRAYFAPFQSESGIAIEAVSHNGKFDVLDPENANNPKWDVIDLNTKALDQACRSGWLEKVDIAALRAANDGTAVRDDFFPGSLHECGVPSVAWSSVIVFDKRAFKKRTPKTAKDFFDVKRFPGKRALPRRTKYTLELALMADGVEPEDVYDVLATDDGIDRALKRLDAIRKHIVWWERAYEPLALLENGTASMATAFNGRVFSAIVADSKPFGIIWDGQVFDVDLWAIPKGTPHVKSAKDFIAFATRPAQLAKQAGWFPYGPMRKSAVELVGRHPDVNVDMSAFIPTSEPNFKRALRLNASWWKEHEERLQERFKVWVIGDGGSADSGADAESENALR